MLTKKDENGFFVFGTIVGLLAAVLITVVTEIPFGMSFLLYNAGGFVVYRIKEAMYTESNGQKNVWDAVYFPVVLWPLTIIAFFVSLVIESILPLIRINDASKERFKF